MINKRNNVIYINVFFFILAAFSTFFLIKHHELFGASDLEFHLKRIISLKKSLGNRYILPSYSFDQFHGAATMLLYPYINLYPAAILLFFIKSKILVIYIFFDLNILLAFLASYYGSLSCSKSREVSFVFAIIYGLSMPFLTYGFYNMDLGALTSIAIFPLIVFGSFDLVFNYKWIKISIGLSMLIFSHVISTLIGIGFLCIIILINLNKINKYTLLILLKLLLFIVLITSIVWIPALKLLVFNATNIYPPIPANNMHGINIISLLCHNIVSSNTSLNIFAIISIFISIIFYKRFSHITRQMYVVSIIMILICSNLFPWGITNYGPFKLIRLVQFPWRFYIIPELLLNYLFVICIIKCIKNTSLKKKLMIIVIIMAILCQALGQMHLINKNNNAPVLTKKYVNKKIYSQTVNIHHMNIQLKQVHFASFNDNGNLYPYYKITNNYQINRLIKIYSTALTPDYYPIKSLSRINNINNNDGIYDGHKIIHFNNDDTFNTLEFATRAHMKKLILPLVNYKHEKLHIYLDKHIMHYYTKNSLIVLRNIKSGTHYLRIMYFPTFGERILELLMIIIWLIWMLLLIMKKLRENFNIRR